MALSCRISDNHGRDDNHHSIFAACSIACGRRSADWRSRCTWLALLFAAISTVAATAFWFSWNASGGSPHGLMPSPGLWVRFRVLWECSLIATFATVILSRGRGGYW